MLTLYHGSQSIVKKPVYGSGKLHNDYGKGFYCTEDIELAKEWACGKNTSGIANEYRIDTRTLDIIRLGHSPYNTLNWIALLLANREFNSPGEFALNKQYIVQNFMPDISSADIVIGYRADDSYFTYAKSFISNGITLPMLTKALRYGNLGEQVVLVSQKAFDALEFVRAVSAPKEIYAEKFRRRDAKAREERLTLVQESGLYIQDIIKRRYTSGTTSIL